MQLTPLVLLMGLTFLLPQVQVLQVLIFILRIGNVFPWNDGTDPGYPTEWQINGTANNGIFSIPVIQENYATNPP